MSNYTPGPWQYQFEGSTTAFIVEHDGTTVSALRVTENSTAHSSFAHNVRLMSAAPDLLEALLIVARMAEDLKKPCGMDPESPQAIRNAQYMNISYAARAAIAKATGEKKWA